VPVDMYDGLIPVRITPVRVVMGAYSTFVSRGSKALDVQYTYGKTQEPTV